MYGSKEYQFMDPERYPVLGWLTQVGPTNVGYLRNVSIHMDAYLDNDLKQRWLEIIKKLSREVTSLELLSVYLDAEGPFHPGLGKDTDIAKALGEIRSVGIIELRGVYSPKWPRYLSLVTGADVWEL